ncbi:MAG: SpoIIE family protein phosphatase [Bacteroidota bacterium]
MRFPILLVLFLISKTLVSQTDLFKSYGSEEGLTAKIIYDIEQDQKGQLLFASEEGIFKFNGYNFTSIEVPNLKERSFVNCLYRSNEFLFFGTNHGELSKSKNGVEFEKIALPSEFNSQIVSFIENEDLWVFSKSSGCAILREDTVLSYALQDQIPLINDAIGISKNVFLLGTNSGLLLIELGKDGQFASRNICQEINSKVTSFAELKEKIWVGTADQSGYFIQRESFEVINSFSSLENFNCSQAIVTENNALWLSSFNKGIARIEGNVVRFIDSSSLLGKKFSSIYQDNTNNIWLGSLESGLYRKIKSPFYQNQDLSEQRDLINYISSSQGKIYQFNDHVESEILSLPGEGVQALASFEEEIIYANESGQIGVITENDLSYILDDSFLFSSVNHIQVDQNFIHISTSANGFIIYDRTNSSIQQFNTQNGLTHNEVSFSFKDSKGIIWLAMSGAVLNAIDGNEIIIFDHKKGLYPYDFTEILEDEQGKIWIASDGAGLYSYENEEFKNYNSTNGLHSNYLNSILCDKKGRIWCSGGKDLSIYESKEERFYTLSTKSSHYDFSINKNGIKLIEDSIHLLTTEGLYLYNPENTIQKEANSPLMFERISINDSVYSLKEDISLPYGKYSLLAEFQKVDFQSQNEISYRFYLDGQEEGYGPEFKDPSCYYPGLLPGRQTLNVISRNSDGTWDKKAQQLNIFIDKPFYQKSGFYLLCLAGLFAGFLLFVFVREKRNKRIQEYLNTELDLRTAEVKEQRNELMVKNKEIEDSILYAETIQKAMLPNKKWLESNCGDHFIYYKPRDIVSGDFYWFSDLGDYFLFAGADCTGHGVPGSMTSMICISELNKAVQVKKLTNPGEILSDVDISVKKALQQNTEFSSMDGMDIGLCLLQKSKRKLHFAGAGRPLYLLQNDELREIRGSRNHIGGDGSEKKDFEVHSFDLNSGNRVYLSSDGYVDQFGGPKGKKFMRKQFRELILKHQNTPLNQQKNVFSKELENWKGKLEQVDDILVLALEF